MNALRSAIMSRRAKLAGDMDFEDRKNANLNPDEGQQDDLSVAQDNIHEDMAEHEPLEQDSGMAPELSEADMNDMGGSMSENDDDYAVPMAPQHAAENTSDQEEKIKSFYSPDDLGKPGIKGKAAAKMAEAMKRFRK